MKLAIRLRGCDGIIICEQISINHSTNYRTIEIFISGIFSDKSITIFIWYSCPFICHWFFSVIRTIGLHLTNATSLAKTPKLIWTGSISTIIIKTK